jgi:hypothetical protein
VLALFAFASSEAVAFEFFLKVNQIRSFMNASSNRHDKMYRNTTVPRE